MCLPTDHSSMSNDSRGPRDRTDETPTAWDPVSDTYRSSVEPGENVAEAVVRVVAEATGDDREELPPLYEAIDPDALNAVFASTPGTERSAGDVTFGYAGREVTVNAASEVVVRPD